MSAPDFNSFKVSQEWQAIVMQLIATKRDYLNEVIENLAKGEPYKAAQLSGKVAMIDEVLGMPDYMYALMRSKGGNHAGEIN